MTLSQKQRPSAPSVRNQLRSPAVSPRLAHALGVRVLGGRAGGAHTTRHLFDSHVPATDDDATDLSVSLSLSSRTGWFIIVVAFIIITPRTTTPGTMPCFASGDSSLSGQITEELMDGMRRKIAGGLLDAADTSGEERVSVSDASGDGSHVTIEVVSKAFEGKTSVQRQRLVYKAIWEELQEAVHAVDAMICKTPQEVKE